MPKLIIDWSVLAHLNWHKMRTKDYTPEFDLELEEFAKNITEHVLYLVTRFQPDETIFAVDAPRNWRHDIYNEYYEKHVDFYKSKTEAQHWYVHVDHDVYRVKKNDATQKWFTDKLKTKELKEIDFDSEDFIKLAGGELPDEIKAVLPEGAPTNARSHPDWQGLQTAVPEYKGTRKLSAWDWETPKDEWKILVKKLAKNLAPLFKAKYVDVENAEGDDIIGVYCLDNKEEEIIMVTIDSDLEQLLIPCPNLWIFNPKKADFVSTTKEAAQMHLLAKILGGDTSDNIKGVALRGRRPFPTVTWDSETGNVKGGTTTVTWIRKQFDIYGEGNYAAIYDALLNKEIKKRGKVLAIGEAETEALNKNLNLVFLANIPGDVQETIRLAVAEPIPEIGINKETEQPFNLQDFGVSVHKELVTKKQACDDRDE